MCWQFRVLRTHFINAPNITFRKFAAASLEYTCYTASGSTQAVTVLRAAHSPSPQFYFGSLVWKDCRALYENREPVSLNSLGWKLIIKHFSFGLSSLCTSLFRSMQTHSIGSYSDLSLIAIRHLSPHQR